jgi:DNA-binding transcriptional regulator GbsR (MarR family)
MNLTTVQQHFILHWGEMGTRWGVNRSVAQIHALLYLSADPLHAEALAETLSIARSNVSTSLRELQGWRLVRVVHVFGDRRDHFETEKDVWSLFQTVLAERKKREVDPTLAALRQCLDEASKEDAYTRARLADMLDFFETTSRWYSAVDRLPRGLLMRFLRLGDRLPAMLGLDGKAAADDPPAE